MVTQQGKTALVLLLVVFLLIIGSFYLGRSSINNSQVSTPTSSPSVAPSPETSSTPQPSASTTNGSVKTMPSPSSASKSDIEIIQESDAKKYTDNKHGFSYKFANSLTLAKGVSDPSFAQFLEYQQGSGNVARMVSQVFENPNNSSLEEVIKRENLSGFNELGPKYEYYKIQGHDALKLTKTMTQTEICNDGDGTTKNRIFNFLVKGDGYVVEIHPNDSCESFKRNWFDITPQSFSFTK